MKVALGTIAALAALALPLAAQAEPSTRQAADVTGWVEGAGPTTAKFGTASLVRTDDSISMSFCTSGIPAGEAVTIWWIILENGAPVSAQYAAGHVVGGSGSRPSRGISRKATPRGASRPSSRRKSAATG